MGVMPERIGKGPILRFLDNRYQEIHKHKHRKDRLTNPANPNDDIADIGHKVDTGENSPVLTDANFRHVKTHWLNKPDDTGKPPEPNWPTAQYVAEILKHGFITALTEADNHNPKLPIETLWICSGRADYISVFVTWNNRQVTLILDTPTLPGGYEDPTAIVREDIWVVKRVWPGAPELVDRPRLSDPNPNKRDVIVVSNAELGSPPDGSIIVKRPVFMP